MNGYVAFWNGKRIEVEAKTAYEAQQVAAVKFGKRCKRWEVTVVLAERTVDGQTETILHSTNALSWGD